MGEWGDGGGNPLRRDSGQRRVRRPDGRACGHSSSTAFGHLQYPGESAQFSHFFIGENSISIGHFIGVVEELLILVRVEEYISNQTVIDTVATIHVQTNNRRPYLFQ